MSVSRALEDGGLTVIGITNSSDVAVEIALRERPDLILLDMRMLGMSGLEAAGRILGVYRPCIVILTASSEAEYLEAAAVLGVSGYIVKPVTADVLMREVESAWEAFRARADEPMGGLPVLEEQPRSIG